MNQSPESKPNPESHENDRPSFEEKFAELLPDVEFVVTAELDEARAAVLEALAGDNQDPDFIRSVWAAYADVAEQTVDSDTDPAKRPKRQIASQVYKALILREAKDDDGYGRDLADAEEYAYDMYLDEIRAAIGGELDSLQNPKEESQA